MWSATPLLHWHSNYDVLMCTACWSRLGASLSSVCVVTSLLRCGGYRLNSTPQMLDHGSNYPLNSRLKKDIYDASQSVLARL